ncbi:hypothetical protein [Shigella sonnei]|uniref:hypothetical protein n=1 Tax=Shigella sonnei TaxID=624 RepID=UPI00069A47BA|nr:hypothetical protein [Shigella sonnei]
MMSLWDALRMNMMISYQELVRTFLSFIDKIEIININNELAEASTVISYSLVDLCKTDQYYR